MAAYPLGGGNEGKESTTALVAGNATNAGAIVLQAGQDLAPHVAKAAKIAGATIAPAIQKGAGHVGQASLVAAGAGMGAVEKGAVALYENRETIKKGAKKVGEAGLVVGTKGVDVMAKGAQKVYENREEIGNAAVAAVAVGGKSVSCAAWLCGEAVANTCNVVRPICSVCGKGLTGGLCCGKRWIAYKMAGCERLICEQCHQEGAGLSLECIKFGSIPQDKPRQAGCFDWLFKRKQEAPPPDYFQGYLSTKDIIETYLPTLALSLAQNIEGVDAQQLESIMLNAESKEQLNELAKKTAIQIVLK
jgi:hypothetical protein